MYAKNSNNYHIVDAIRMQMEVQRRLHEQLEVILFTRTPLQIKIIIILVFQDDG